MIEVCISTADNVNFSYFDSLIIGLDVSRYLGVRSACKVVALQITYMAHYTGNTYRIFGQLWFISSNLSHIVWYIFWQHSRA